LRVKHLDLLPPPVEHRALVDIGLVGDFARAQRRRLVQQDEAGNFPAAAGAPVVSLQTLPDERDDAGIAAKIERLGVLRTGRMLFCARRTMSSG
jgi:hypothetical protein